jgi:5-hydroxyisourate hydrolase
MISTHILDTTLGKPAVGVSVTLEKKSASGWSQLATDKTNADGRIVFNAAAEAGTYKLSFKIENYFQSLKQDHFFENAEVCFKISDTTRKYHVPLLLNPFGYSTYRGS